MKNGLLVRGLSLAVVFALNASATSVMLDGKSANSSQIVEISRGAKVEIDENAMKRVKKSHDVLLEAAKTGHKIYGLTVGVGLNKDRQMVDPSGNLSTEVIEASKQFNTGLIHAHCGGVGDDMDIKTARAVLATRLNNMLFGGTGVQSEVVELYKDFLNHDIVPVMPTKGSMGEADITILGHVGLAMIGEGEVYYKGKKMAASDALKKAGLKKLSPFGKDSLSILSSNAYSAALGALALEEMRHLSKISKYVYAISLEAFNGNIAPMHQEANRLRPFPDYVRVSEQIRGILEGSYLWNQDDARALQDPLSYRDAAYILGTLDSSIDRLEHLMMIQFNSSDDNPGVSVDVSSQSERFQEKKVYVEGKDFKGAVVPTANFEPLPWVIAFEEAAISLAHNSAASAQRTIKLSDDGFTKLTRFLGTDKTVHAFGAMQKPFVALAGENRALANPVSLNHVPVAGNIEDVATNAPLAVSRVRMQIENLYAILGMELMHAAQAIDLRKQKNPELKLSPATEQLYREYRKIVKFLEEDRPLSNDFKNSSSFLKNYNY
ncbi:aromatic amino acid ammonia-lyase [Wolinella succinogenes]|uniref:HAL/PAL/TAL family ammonia-lyase n=1 Tax=Wolinella succinogenes TaxID=844 RepID=UPI002FCB2220